MVAKRADLDEVKKEAVKEGMTPLLEDGLLKIESGLTTIEEVLRAVRE
jgi:type IV pilus assembly protein PilB